MPTYSFICDTCNENVDLMLPVDQRDVLRNCPRCAGGQLLRIITAAPVHFKGSGFYSTGG